ncbi:hypothetical protein A499_03403 [Niallia nealsonii AAU1]|nr:hypothetical protein A499_03403 [Niallia nealsonii AAU1]
MSIKKKIYGLVLSGAVVLSIGSFTAFAADGNYRDEAYSYGFPIGTTTDYTDARTKINDTSSYMKLQKLTGATSPSYTASVVDFNGNNFSKVWYVTFNKSSLNQGRYIKNFAWEDNKKEVQVRIKAVRGADKNGFSASGVWSPDSI